MIALTFGTLEADIAWAERLSKLLPLVTFLVRGAPCYVWADRILSSTAVVSGCLCGDYELATQNVLKLGLSCEAGCITRGKAGGVIGSPVYASRLDDLPLPDRSSIDPSTYCVRGSKSAQATIHVQRGCPYPCTYCLVHTVSGSTARHRSAAHILTEVKELQSTGMKHFYFRAETFTLNRAWVVTLCEALIRECADIRWVTTTRVDRVDLELLELMRAAGCYGISFGIDVACQEVGERVKKRLSCGQTRDVMRWCDKVGIVSLGYFMVGFAWDSHKSLQATRAFIRKVRPNLLTIHFAHPYPGTVYYAETQAAGLHIESKKLKLCQPFLYLS